METLLALLAVCALSLFFTSLPGVKSAAAPLLSLGCAMVFLALAGVLGVLLPGAVVFYLLCFGLGAFAFFRRGGMALVKRLPSPGFLIFVGMALVLLVYFAARQPVFSQWDEFSFWGSAAKKTHLAHGLYVSIETNSVWPSAQPPSLIMLGYFVQCFGAFAPWKVYWAYALLMLAGAAALTAAFEAKQWRCWLPVAVIGLMLPFCFNVYYETTSFSTTWLSAYADIPAGMLMGGGLAVYLALRRDGGPVWLAAIPLGAFALTKENLLPLALVAAMVMAADGLLLGRGWDKKLRRPARDGQRRGLAVAGMVGRKAAGFLGWFAVPLALNTIWQRYAAWAVRDWPALNQGSVENSLGSAVNQILGLAPRNERFWPVLQEMADQFLGRAQAGDGYQYGLHNASMLGSGLVTLLVVLAVFVAAVLLLRGKRPKLRGALFGGLLLCGFWAYQFGLFVVYAFYNRADYQTVFDYARYMATCFLGMVMPGLVLLGMACGQEKAMETLRPKLAQAAVLALACVLVWRGAVQLRPGYTVLDYPDTVYDEHRVVTGRAEQIAAALPQDAKLFFLDQQGDGSGWYEYAYNLMPVVLDYSLIGGRNFAPDEEYPLLNPEGVAGYVQDSGLEYALVISVDELFLEQYSFIFADGLQDFVGEPALYRMNADGLYERMAY